MAREYNGGHLPPIDADIAEQVGSTAVHVEVLVELDVIAAYKMMGPDWRQRMGAVLSDAAHYLRPIPTSDPILLSSVYRQSTEAISGSDSVQILHRGGGWVVRVYENNEIVETRHAHKRAASDFAGSELKRLHIT